MCARRVLNQAATGLTEQTERQRDERQKRQERREPLSSRHRFAREGDWRASQRGVWTAAGAPLSAISSPLQCRGASRALGTNPWGTGNVHFSRKLGHTSPRSVPICSGTGDGDLLFRGDVPHPHPHPCSQPAAPSQKRLGPQLLRERRAHQTTARSLQRAPQGREDLSSPPPVRTAVPTPILAPSGVSVMWTAATEAAPAA